MQGLRQELDVAQEACRRAGEIIRRHYDSGSIDARLKEDSSPLTDADLEANEVILALLRSRFPEDGILSEETADDGARLGAARVWIVDPLDGTRDFLKRSGDFAVHVGLALEGKPALGAVYKPIGDQLYWAATGAGAHLIQNGREVCISTSSRARTEDLRIGVTRFNINENLRRFLDASGLRSQVVPVGASIKMMALARGDIELSVCLNADEKEWDTCAPEIIVREAGGCVSDIDGAPFSYNKPDVRHTRGILMSHGPRHADLVKMLGPYFSS